MPSGIPVGTELGGPMRDALTRHTAGLPLSLQPIIEDGTPEEIKACIFRALSGRTCEIWLEDIAVECSRHGFKCEVYGRQWSYQQTTALKCVTSAQVRFVTTNAEVDIEEFMAFLSTCFEFRYNRLRVNRRKCTQIDFDRVILDPSIEVEAEIMWPYWM